MIAPPDEQVRAGQIASKAIRLARELCSSPIDGIQLDKEIETFILDEGGRPALKGYHPYFAPKPYEWTICLAIDNDVVHGVPLKMVRPSQLITVDLVVEYKGWHADTARTFTINGNATFERFANVSRAIFRSALEMILPQQPIELYGIAVNSACLAQGYSVVKEYCGHGIGRVIHAEPQVVNYPIRSKEVFKVGKAYAVEPVIAMKSIYKLDHSSNDGFSVRADCLVSHNEDTVFISNRGVINLTGGNDE